MRRRSKPCCRAQRGVTLIEAIAGLVILGTILSSAVIARGRFQRQIRDADNRLAAIRAADELVGKWLSQPIGTAPVPGSGDVGASSELIWRSSWVRDRAAQRLGARIARLDIFDRRGRARTPLLSIEFLLRPAPPTTREVAR